MGERIYNYWELKAGKIYSLSQAYLDTDWDDYHHEPKIVKFLYLVDSRDEVNFRDVKMAVVEDIDGAVSRCDIKDLYRADAKQVQEWESIRGDDKFKSLPTCIE